MASNPEGKIQPVAPVWGGEKQIVFRFCESRSNICFRATTAENHKCRSMNLLVVAIGKGSRASVNSRYGAEMSVPVLIRCLRAAL
jgi:hypothetical protein